MHVAALLVTVASIASAIPTSDTLPLHPSHETVKENAHHIFNAIHSAARQWGSSLNHNGMGFIPAVVPKGTLLHHGSHRKAIPTSFEWLAFEVEHAENFANSRRSRNPNDEGDAKQQTLGDIESSARPPFEKLRGYLHTYQARRDLKLLYLDGSAAAKTDMGTLDSQDYVLRVDAGNSELFEEWPRAQELCDTMTSWGYDGLIRTEIGFEVIHCNFTSSLDLVSQTRTVVGEDKMTGHELWHFDFARAASRRYDGIGAGRIKLDYSSMISGFFFPINISSQTPDRPELFRFASARTSELDQIRDTIGQVAGQPRKYTVNWQNVVDQVVTRFTDRLAFLTAEEGVTDRMFRDELEGLTLAYYDAPPLPDDEEPEFTLEMYYETKEMEAIKRCSEHFLLPALVFKDDFSQWDELIYTAVAEVTHTVCEKTQKTWIHLNQTTSASSLSDTKIGTGEEVKVPSHEPKRRSDATMLKQGVQAARSAIQELMDELAWTEWKKTRPCPPNAFIYVAMWPFGTKNDHWNPGCRSVKDLLNPEKWFGYWGDFRL